MHETYQGTATTNYPAATVPTMYFIGVTTAHSAMRRIFPLWAAKLGLGGEDEVKLVGIDFMLHDDPAAYRRAVEFIRNDPLSLGALVTSHKLDLLHACRDLFDELDEDATLLDEVACVSKRDGKLIGRAVDAINAGLAMDAFLPRSHWRDTAAHLLLLGAGGSAMATVCCLLNRTASERPLRIVVTDRNESRLASLRGLCDRLDKTADVRTIRADTAADNDACVFALPSHSLIINATGMGKDLPGSPLTDAAVFPEHAIAWDYNYRGELRFLEQARAQAATRQVRTEDGWIYFLHRRLRVLGAVFALDVPPRRPPLQALAATPKANR